MSAGGAEGGEDWGGVLPNRLGGLGERCELPSRVLGEASASNAFLVYLRPTEHFW